MYNACLQQPNVLVIPERIGLNAWRWQWRLGLAIGLCFLCLPATADETTTELISPASSHIRTLAATCAACHGTNGNSVNIVPSLAAMPVAHFMQKMQGFRDGTVSSTVMHQHAAGLTVSEIEQLAQYFSQQPLQPKSPVKPLGAGF